MKNKKLRILTYGIAALVFLIVAILYPRLPDQIPTHWNFDGSVTSLRIPLQHLEPHRHASSVCHSF